VIWQIPRPHCYASCDERSIEWEDQGMRAARIHAKRDMRIEQVPSPEPDAGQVSLRVGSVGICESDLHYYADGAAGIFALREPLIPGHEVSGVIDFDPTGAFEAGTPVTVHPATWGTAQPDLSEEQRHLWPGGGYLGSASTWPHTPGALAEQLVIHRDQVRRLPASLPVRRAALAEPLAVGLHGLAVGGGVRGKRVLISGSGPIGLLTAAAAAAGGAMEVVSADVLAGPLQRARYLGAASPVPIATVQIGVEDLPDSHFDLTLECAGVPQALHGLLLATRRAGVLVQVGNLPDEARLVNLAPLVSKEIQVRGTFRFNDEIDAAITLLDQNPQIEQVVTHVLPFEEVKEAFAIAGNPELSGKVLVEVSAL
jgi:L-idonate 5-dehydrogenase